MLTEIPRIAARFIFLILLQVLIVQNIDIGGMVNPQIYVLFILALPFETPLGLLLLLSFLAGISVDLFTDTAGLHASACVFMAFLRPYLLKRIAPRDGYEFGVKPSLQQLGFSWYLSYCGILIAAHHFWLFMLEIYSLQIFFYTLLNIIFSSMLSIVFIVLAQYLTFKPRAR